MPPAKPRTVAARRATRAAPSRKPPRARAGAAIYFASPAEFRAWLARHHATHDELLVGFHKRETGRPSLTWPESVEEALCFGWIDGVRRGVDAGRYTIRFTPRRPRSMWSAKNVATAEALIASGRMQPAGARAFAARDEARIYSYEGMMRAARLAPAEERALRANRAAWTFFGAQPPSYRRAAYYWVSNAKRPETRAARLAALIADSAAGRKVKALRRPGE